MVGTLFIGLRESFDIVSKRVALAPFLINQYEWSMPNVSSIDLNKNSVRIFTITAVVGAKSPRPTANKMKFRFPWKVPRRRNVPKIIIGRLRKKWNIVSRAVKILATAVITASYLLEIFLWVRPYMPDPICQA